MAEQPSITSPDENTTESTSTGQHLPYWTGNGYCRQPNGYEIKKIEFNLPHPQDELTVAGMGKLVTSKAANNMFKDYIEALIELLERFPNDPEGVKENLKKLISTRVIFGKEALLFLLAQPNCEGIRFYSCLKINQKEATPSLILVGVDKDRNDLGDSIELNKKSDYHSIITSEAAALEPDSTAVERQSTAIVEVGGTDSKRFGGEALRINTIVSLEDELLARGSA